MNYKTVKFGLYLGLGLACIPLITLTSLTISQFTVGILLASLFHLLKMAGNFGQIAMLIISIFAIYGLFWLWLKMTNKSLSIAGNVALKKLRITKEQETKTRHLKEAWTAISGALSLLVYLLIGIYYFLESFHAVPRTLGSKGLSNEAKNSVSNAYKECAVKEAMQEISNSSEHQFTESLTDHYQLLPVERSCKGDTNRNITAKSINETLNPSFAINTVSGTKTCTYKGSDPDQHGCKNGLW